MARDTDALRIEKWAATGDRQTPEAAGLTRTAGWTAAYSTPGGSAPARETVNQLFAELSAAAVDVLRHGIAEWDAGQRYDHPAIVHGGDGRLYRSARASGPGTANAAQDPEDDTAGNTWTLFDFSFAGAATTGEGAATDQAVTPAGLLAALFAAAPDERWRAAAGRYGLTRPATDAEIDNAAADPEKHLTVPGLERRLAALVNGAPDALDTLGELAAAVQALQTSNAAVLARLPRTLFRSNAGLAITTTDAGTNVNFTGGQTLTAADDWLEVITYESSSNDAGVRSVTLPVARIGVGDANGVRWALDDESSDNGRAWLNAALPETSLRLEVEGTHRLLGLRAWRD